MTRNNTLLLLGLGTLGCWAVWDSARTLHDASEQVEAARKKIDAARASADDDVLAIRKTFKDLTLDVHPDTYNTSGWRIVQQPTFTRAENATANVHVTRWTWIDLAPTCTPPVSRAACMSQTKQIGPGVVVEQMFVLTSPIVDIEQIGNRFVVTPKDQHVFCAPRTRRKR